MTAERLGQWQVRALLGTAPGVVVYDGPSRIDGKRIVAIVTGFSKSLNLKTGDMLQTWILAAGVSPIDALATRADASICGGCPHRPQVTRDELPAGRHYAERSCYVRPQVLGTIWQAWRRGSYASVPLATVTALCAGRDIRLGAYGDPAAVPLAVWDAMASEASLVLGYTHQWRAPRLRDVTKYCQASCDTPADYERAIALGLGTFRVKSAAEPILPGERVCPASAEAGHKATCAECGACQGLAPDSPYAPKHRVIDGHGGSAALVTLRAARRATVTA